MQANVDWQGTAGLLRAGFRASMAGHAGAVLAGMGQGPARLVALAAWGYLVYLQVRVSLDVELFTLLANGVAPGEMDGFLVRAGLIKSPRERSPEDRCRGALRLWRQLMIVLVIELVAVVIALR
jgi:hypothetical protein